MTQAQTLFSQPFPRREALDFTMQFLLTKWANTRSEYVSYTSRDTAELFKNEEMDKDTAGNWNKKKADHGDPSIRESNTQAPKHET